MKRNIDEETKSNFPLSTKLLDCQTMFLSEDGVWEKMKFLAGIQTLISFAFIEANSQLYSMHYWYMPGPEIEYQKQNLLICVRKPEHCYQFAHLTSIEEFLPAAISYCLAFTSINTNLYLRLNNKYIS